MHGPTNVHGAVFGWINDEAHFIVNVIRRTKRLWALRPPGLWGRNPAARTPAGEQVGEPPRSDRLQVMMQAAGAARELDVFAPAIDSRESSSRSIDPHAQTSESGEPRFVARIGGGGASRATKVARAPAQASVGGLDGVVGAAPQICPGGGRKTSALVRCDAVAVVRSATSRGFNRIDEYPFKR
jgi:hypothetical protein